MGQVCQGEVDERGVQRRAALAAMQAAARLLPEGVLGMLHQ